MILALFDAITGRDARDRTVSGLYRRRVPLGTPLTLTTDRTPSSTHLRLSDATSTLVEGSVGPGRGAPETATVSRALRVAPTRQTALPVSKTCFACGTENTLGLRARLTIDDDRVSGTWTPSDAFRAAEALAPVALTTLLDEAAFWLGAAASGEAGMTTDLRVRLHAPATYGGIVVAGSRASVQPSAEDSRYWQTDVAAWDESGALVASAAITFVAVRGAARKLVTGLLGDNPPDVLRRVFPTYVR